MRTLAILLFPAIAVIGVDAASAASAPPALYGKSITLSWTTARVRRNIATGDVQHHGGAAELKVYVSSTGRIFSEKVGVGTRGGRHRRQNIQVAYDISDAAEYSEIRDWRVEGRSLVAYKTFNSGARRIVIDFDQTYSSCTARVSFAKAAGRPAIIQGGHRWEILSIEVTSTTCSVAQGNVFGQ